jgi:4a-hydroxytetrahydrobiopterin dehydratase
VYVRPHVQRARFFTRGEFFPSREAAEDPKMAKLNPGEITTKLKGLEGWQQKDNAIVKRYQFKEFLDGIKFVNRVAEIAEAADHHPDILINYTRVTFTCSTHSDGGITDKDIKLASDIEAAYKSTQKS